MQNVALAGAEGRVNDCYPMVDRNLSLLQAAMQQKGHTAGEGSRTARAPQPPSPEELPLGDQDTSGRGTSGGEPSSSSSQQQYPPLNDSGEEEVDPPQETLVRDTHNFYIVSSDVS